MKILHFSAILLIVLAFSCKPEKKNNSTTTETELSVPEKIAYAHGLKEWKNVEELKFTFNFDRDTTHFERDWIWNIKKNQVTRISAGESSTYYRNEIDTAVAKIDAGFINDKFWFLAPFNLIWDKDNFSYEVTQTAASPIGKVPMQKLTIVYSNEGGYTPGDAYDFYFGKDYVIKEWVFRKSNQEEASLATTWEEYSDFNGLTISKTRKNAQGNTKWYFTKIEVK